MNLKDILAISGEGTLFKFIAQGKNAVIVENLENGRRMSAGATAKVSALDEIAIFTAGEDTPLARVMDLIWEKENGGETLSHKLPDAELKSYFATVLPDYDRERVYTSDIRKVLHWYNILHKLNLLVKEEEKPEEPETSQTAPGDAGDAEKTVADVSDTTGTDEKKKPVKRSETGAKSGAGPKKAAPAKGSSKPATGQ